MSLLGVIENEELGEQISEALKSDGEATCLIENKEALNRLNGLIIPITHREQVTETISWLLECKNYSALFVWIFSTIQLTNEETILIQLGTNAIVSDEDQFYNFIQLIKNDMQRINFILTHSVEESVNVINSENQSAYVDGEEVGLTKREYELFSLLYKNKGTCVSYKEITNTLWPASSKVDLFRIANIVFHLRNKIRNSQDFDIRTVRNKGYMFYYKK